MQMPDSHTETAIVESPRFVFAKRIFGRILRDIKSQRIVAVAAGVTFYSLLAIFPAIAALVALYGMFADASTIGRHLAALTGLLPEGAISVIGDEIARIVVQPGQTLGAALAVGVFGSLWSASGGTKSLFDAFNVVYGERERRSFLRLTAVSLAFVVGGILFLCLTLTAVVALPLALDHLGVGARAQMLIAIVRWPILFVVVALMLALLYRFGPSRSHPRWRWFTWGSAFAATGWIVVSLLFSWYTAHFGQYNKTYGSLGAAVGFMIWIWLSMIVILIGAKLDDILERVEYAPCRPPA